MELTITALFLLMGLGLLFEGSRSKNSYMIYSGAIFLMMVGAVINIEGISTMTGIALTETATGSTTAFVFSANTEWYVSGLGITSFLLGLFGLFIPVLGSTKEKAKDENKGGSI